MQGPTARSIARNPRLALEYLADRLALDRQRSFFFMALEYQHRLAQHAESPEGAYYEFGVGWGGTLTKYLSARRSFCRALRLDGQTFPTYAFDSFKGLPESSDPRDQHPLWKPGTFAYSREAVTHRLRVKGLPTEPPTVNLIEGTFAETLTTGLRNDLARNPPAIVTIDVDYYSSTRVVLEWLRPMLVSGTIFYFDDIWSFHGNPDLGELAAIRDFNSEGHGRLTGFPVLGLASYVYIYSAPTTP
jgi:Macrocin-O-methyltransferase (TylF)